MRKTWRQGLLVVLLLFLLPQVDAKQPLAWIVEPTTCVTDKLASSCQMQVQVYLINPRADEYCVTLNDRQLKCWDGKGAIKLDLVYARDASLKLTDRAGKALLVSKLTSKALSFRRRVRAPWSLF